MKTNLHLFGKQSILLMLSILFLEGCSTPSYQYRVDISDVSSGAKHHAMIVLCNCMYNGRDVSSGAKHHAMIGVVDWKYMLRHRSFAVWTNEIPSRIQFEFPSKNIRIVALSSDGRSLFQDFLDATEDSSIVEIKLKPSNSSFLYNNLKEEFEYYSQRGPQIFPTITTLPISPD